MASIDATIGSATNELPKLQTKVAIETRRVSQQNPLKSGHRYSGARPEDQRVASIVHSVDDEIIRKWRERCKRDRLVGGR